MDVSEISNRLSASPMALPDCCLSISSTLIAYLASLLPSKPGVTVSIGSGSGLLEALIAHRHPDVSVQGIEVDHSVNRYIAEQDMNVVDGTWALYSDAPQARAWMFVYPREPKLVSQYLETCDHQAVEIVLWLGPRVDWADYEPCFRNSSFSESSLPEDIGLAPFEMLAVLKRKGETEKTPRDTTYLEKIEKEGPATNAVRLADEGLHKPGAELSDPNLETGEGSPSVFPCFMPSHNDAFQLASSGSDPTQDRFWKYNRDNTKRAYGDHGLPEYLGEAFRDHAAGLCQVNKPIRRRRTFLDESKTGRHFSTNHATFRVVTAVEILRGHQSHYWICGFADKISTNPQWRKGIVIHLFGIINIEA